MEKWKIQQENLLTPFNLEGLDFETTNCLSDLKETPGQERAYLAMEFGFNIRQKGFNLYAMGPCCSGKYVAIKEFLNDKASGENVPWEWCYVNNFEKSHRPLYLKFPAGRANEFKEDNKRLLEDLHGAILSAFVSEGYRNKRQEIEEELKNKQQDELSDIRERAKKEGISLIETPAGIAFAPIIDGNVLMPEQITNLPGNRIQQKPFFTVMR